VFTNHQTARGIVRVEVPLPARARDQAQIDAERANERKRVPAAASSQYLTGHEKDPRFEAFDAAQSSVTFVNVNENSRGNWEALAEARQVRETMNRYADTNNLSRNDVLAPAPAAVNEPRGRHADIDPHMRQRHLRGHSPGE
jgi:hypothetical protein